MDFYTQIFELIDLRSFSNLWFWIMLAVVWSSTSHWVLGVPWDMVTRARRAMASEEHAELQGDLRAMVIINAGRISHIAHQSGLLMAGFGCFILTMLATLGFFYAHEFSQALFLLGFPMSLVGIVSVATSRRILREELEGEALYKLMQRHRMITQVIGMVAIFVTGLWGMYQNLTNSALY